jgi:hypothetical protein
MKYIMALILFHLSMTVAYSQTPATLNPIIKEIVDDFRQNRAGGGYDMSGFFTRDLKYGSDCCIKSKNPPVTMCVAGVAEVIVEALNLYSKRNGGDETPFKKLPISSWTKGNLKSIRANLFMYDGTGSRGTGHALERLGLGREKTFADLRPYDFVNLNRNNNSGHAVVFISYLDKDSKETTTYSPAVIGFHYFSAQGHGKPDAGFADRYAYFDGKCPDKQLGTPRDCGVIRSGNKALLDGGELWTPSAWKTDEANANIEQGVRGIFSARYPGLSKGLLDSKIEQELNRELQPNLDQFIGDTTD